MIPVKADERECAECHNVVSSQESDRRGVFCSICRHWFCRGCYKGFHIWDCREE